MENEIIDFIIDGWAEKGEVIGNVLDRNGVNIKITKVLNHRDRLSNSHYPYDVYAVTPDMQDIHWLDLD